MRQKQDGTNHQNTVCFQPWWRGIGHDPISADFLGETTASLSPSKNSNDSLGSKTRKLQVEDGLDEGNDVNKKIEITLVSQTGILFMVVYETSTHRTLFLQDQHRGIALSMHDTYCVGN